VPLAGWIIARVASYDALMFPNVREALASGSLLLSILVGCAKSPARPPGVPVEERCPELVLMGATLYPAPDAAPLPNATIRMNGGIITSVSANGNVPPTPCAIDVGGRVVTAGFWNSHVHHTQSSMGDETQAAALIEEMFLRHGFTSVVDAGADPHVLFRLRDWIEAERIPGPRLVIAGGSFVYRDATPSYLPKGLLPEVTDPAAAPTQVSAVLDAGADGIKIFSGSFQTPTYTVYLPVEIIEAITRAAHGRGAFVISHPTDGQGVENAVAGGVDILAHTAPPAGAWAPELIERMLAAHMALIPTLKLWHWELGRRGVPDAAVQSYIERGVAQLHDYHAAGGEILFGTDVGYMTDYDPTEEYELMHRAGLDFRAILASLTVAPSRRFGDARGGTHATGTVEAGSVADLVVLKGDPTSDVRAFAEPLVTIRKGQVVYRNE
jgi:imidazolonepropionase-like amidohydrolase